MMMKCGCEFTQFRITFCGEAMRLYDAKESLAEATQVLLASFVENELNEHLHADCHLGNAALCIELTAIWNKFVEIAKRRGSEKVGNSWVIRRHAKILK